MNQPPKISFGIMVLNGEPFVEAQLRALYQHAHQIIVAHGAVERARINATSDGKSLDNTGKTLQHFKENHDPEDKIIIIEKEGFYLGHDELCAAYANQATGDYLWQIDIDEFYQPEDIERIRDHLTEDPSITGVSVRWRNLWGHPDYETDGWFRLEGGFDVHRILKWGRGYTYADHLAGPDSLSPEGKRASSGKWLCAEELASEGVYCYHYGFLFPHQVFRKQALYAGGGDLNRPAKRDQSDPNEAPNYWAQAVWERLEDPFYIHNVPHHVSWLKRFKGTHPPEVTRLFHRLATQPDLEQLREKVALNQLVSSPRYRIAITLLGVLGWLHYNKRMLGRLRNIAKQLAIKVEVKTSHTKSIRLRTKHH